MNDDLGSFPGTGATFIRPLLNSADMYSNNSMDVVAKFNPDGISFDFGF